MKFQYTKYPLVFLDREFCNVLCYMNRHRHSFTGTNNRDKKLFVCKYDQQNCSMFKYAKNRDEFSVKRVCDISQHWQTSRDYLNSEEILVLFWSLLTLLSHIVHIQNTGCSLTTDHKFFAIYFFTKTFMSCEDRKILLK